MFIAILFALILGAPGPVQITFEDVDAPRLIPAGAALAVADFDGDGLLDIAAAGEGDDVNVLLGNGNGRFGSPIHSALGGEAEAMHVTDFNGDGIPDLLAASDETRYHVLLGAGDGSFELREFSDQGRSPRGIATGDFDGDGFEDIAGLHFADVAVLLGDGSGNFSAPILTPLATSPPAFVAGDVNEDQAVDLVLRDDDPAQILVLLADGSGGFAPGTTLTPDPAAVSATMGDMNGNGHLDLVFNDAELGLGLLPGAGDGTFGPPEAFFFDRRVLFLDLDDVDQDGSLDIVAANGASSASIIRSDGAGGFLPPRSHWLGSVPIDLATGDLDRDGRGDVVTILDSELTVLLTGPDCELPAPRAVGADRIRETTYGDFNEDGHLDFAVIRTESVMVDVHLVDPTTGSIDRSSFVGRSGLAESLNSGDFNGDGHRDIVVTGPGLVSVHLGDGTGQFALNQRLMISVSTPAALRVGRFDEDSDLDLIFANRLGAGVTFLRNDGNGTFTQGGQFATEGFPDDMVRFDFDGDGNLDFLTAGRVLRFGNGLGGFPVATTITPEKAVPVQDHIQHADVNGDGNRDVVIEDRVYLGDGAGQFEEVADTGLPVPLFGHQDFDLADFDDDGTLDAAYAGREGDMEIYRGNGDGTFRLVGRIEMTPGFKLINAKGDLDGDGLRDLLVGHSSAALIFLNRTFFAETIRGNVNDGVGPITDVLFVNGSAGSGPLRRVGAPSDDTFRILMNPAPENLHSKFALYAWTRLPGHDTITPVGFGLGSTSLPTPLSESNPVGLRAIWNNIGSPVLGVATHPSTRAPSFVVNAQNGVGVSGIFFLQGFLIDEGSSSIHDVSVTNGVLVVID